MNFVKVIELPKFLDERGNLSFVEQERHIPFEIARSYWIYDVPGGEIRVSSDSHWHQLLSLIIGIRKSHSYDPDRMVRSM